MLRKKYKFGKSIPVVQQKETIGLRKRKGAELIMTEIFMKAITGLWKRKPVELIDGKKYKGDNWFTEKK